MRPKVWQTLSKGGWDSGSHLILRSQMTGDLRRALSGQSRGVRQARPLPVAPVSFRSRTGCCSLEPVSQDAKGGTKAARGLGEHCHDEWAKE